MDRFDLEDTIMAAWQTENDLELFVEQYYDGSKIMSQDDVANVLIGLKEIHSLRMNKLWDTFTKTYKLDNHVEKSAESAEISTQNVTDPLRKAAEMALEALKDYRFASGFERPLAQDAIDALRQALAQPEQEPVAYKEECLACGGDECVCAARLPKRPLTDTEAFLAMGKIPLQKHITDDFILVVVRATEAAHGIRGKV